MPQPGPGRLSGTAMPSGLLFAAVLVSGMAGYSPAAVAQDYDMDCAVILCMAGGFAPDECRPALAYMSDRLRRLKPPFGTCILSNGSPYEHSQVDLDRPGRYSEDAYHCRQGDQLFLDITYSENSDPVRARGICYSRSYNAYQSVEGENILAVFYEGAYPAERAEYRLQLTVENGLAGEWVSPEYLIGPGGIINPDNMVPGPRNTEVRLVTGDADIVPGR